MKTIQMTLEPKLLEAMDRAVKRLGTTRSDLIRASVRRYLDLLDEQQLERRHRAGYLRRPVRRGEFDVWETEQKWGD